MGATLHEDCIAQTGAIYDGVFYGAIEAQLMSHG